MQACFCLARKMVVGVKTRCLIMFCVNVGSENELILRIKTSSCTNIKLSIANQPPWSNIKGIATEKVNDTFKLNLHSNRQVEYSTTDVQWPLLN